MKFFRRNNVVRRWYKKKRWRLIMVVAAIALYRNYAPDGAILQEQLNSLLDLLPGFGEDVPS